MSVGQVYHLDLAMTSSRVFLMHYISCISEIKRHGSLTPLRIGSLNSLNVMRLQSHLRSALKQPNSQDRPYRSGIFLRLLPLIIGDRVKATADDVDIVGMMFLFKNIKTRKALFTERSLKPRHHYVHHCQELNLESGPSIRLWTTCFERKHSYFKRCARISKDFFL